MVLHVRDQLKSSEFVLGGFGFFFVGLVWGRGVVGVLGFLFIGGFLDFFFFFFLSFVQSAFTAVERTKTKQ